jgi:5'-deoxynucleotidase YfbR-like HD superfamily hydrolase
MSSDTCAPWAQTSTGLAVDLLDPLVEQISITDISTALERIPRFNGHTIPVWSVAQHSLAVETEFQPTGALPEAGERLAALLHDAHEAYTGDIISPMQVALATPDLKAIQHVLQQTIHARFGLPRVLPDATIAAIKQADLVILATEKDQLMVKPPRAWMDLPTPSAQDLRKMIGKTEDQFRWRFRALMNAWHQLG